jgi:hypothetical protein
VKLLYVKMCLSTFLLRFCGCLQFLLFLPMDRSDGWMDSVRFGEEASLDLPSSGGSTYLFSRCFHHPSIPSKFGGGGCAKISKIIFRFSRARASSFLNSIPFLFRSRNFHVLTNSCASFTLNLRANLFYKHIRTYRWHLRKEQLLSRQE